MTSVSSPCIIQQDDVLILEHAARHKLAVSKLLSRFNFRKKLERMAKPHENY